MKLTLIRNATMILEYGGKTFVVDPYLADKHSHPPFGGISDNPTVDLPMTKSEVLSGIEGVLVTHLHPDHFDEDAKHMLPKTMDVFCTVDDAEKLTEMGFRMLHLVADSRNWDEIEITRVEAQHGRGKWAERLAPVSGYVLKADGEPSIYITSDTIMYEGVREAILKHQPDVVVTCSGGAHFGDEDIIIMDDIETIELAQLASEAQIVAVHLESLDHCPVTRTGLRQAADEAGISTERFHIPADGETLELK